MGHGRKISVVGLGYVGLPVAVAFGKHKRTVGFDINATPIAELKAGVERSGEVSPDHWEVDKETLRITGERLAEKHVVAYRNASGATERRTREMVLRTKIRAGRLPTVLVDGSASLVTTE